MARGAVGERSVTEGVGDLGTGEFSFGASGVEYGGYDARVGHECARGGGFFLAVVRAEVAGRKVHCYAPITLVYGREPEVDEGL
jgi:hypothetical protein